MVTARAGLEQTGGENEWIDRRAGDPRRAVLDAFDLCRKEFIAASR